MKDYLENPVVYDIELRNKLVKAPIIIINEIGLRGIIGREYSAMYSIGIINLNYIFFFERNISFIFLYINYLKCKEIKL